MFTEINRKKMNCTDECDAFFGSTLPPENISAISSRISSFVEKHNKLGHKIVLVTSGGTTVPLESRTVRFIDNFSVGTRGSASAEYFLSQAYAVIFLHRQRSLQPFSRHIDNVLDILTLNEDNSITVKEDHKEQVARTLGQYQKVTQNDTLLKISFTSVHEYLHLLRACSSHLQTAGSRAMLYLAAAVADFHVPSSKMPEHKIQSSDGPLQLTLDLVPKMLKPLVKNWVPKAFIVSFKLETDEQLLIHKSRNALSTYNHQMVVANLLDKRKTEVVLVTMTTVEPLKLSAEDENKGVEIEQKIVSLLTKHHSEFCGK